MQAGRLQVIDQRPMMFAAGGQRSKKKIEAEKSKTADDPTAEEFSKKQLSSRQWFGEQREKRAVFLFRRYLAGGGRDRDDQRRNPDQKQADSLEIADNVLVVENIHGSHYT